MDRQRSILSQNGRILLPMAQVCGGTTFDLAFKRKHETAQDILSRAADFWAARGREALDPDSVIAVSLVRNQSEATTSVIPD